MMEVPAGPYGTIWSLMGSNFSRLSDGRTRGADVGRAIGEIASFRGAEDGQERTGRSVMHRKVSGRRLRKQ